MITKFKLLLIFLVFNSTSLFSQESIEISFSGSDFKISNQIYLFGYKYGQLLLIDSSSINSDGKAQLRNKNYIGFGLVSPSKSNFNEGINLILNPNENKVNIECSYTDFLQGKYDFTYSISNYAKLQLQNISLKYIDDFKNLNTIKKSLNPQSTTYQNDLKKLDLQYYKVYHQMNKAIDSVNNTLGKEYRFLKEVYIPSIKVPTIYDFENDDSTLTRKQFLQKNFFHFIDFQNELTYHNPGIVDAFEFYLSNAIPFTEAGYYAAIDKFVQLTHNLDQKKKNFIFDFLENYFTVRNFDYVVQYLDDVTGSCAIEPSDNQNKALQLKDVELCIENKIVYLEDLLMPDVLNVLYIWIDWCQACIQKAPKTKEALSDINKLKAVNIITIEADAYFENHNSFKGFKNYYEKTQLVDSKLLPFLKVSTTPAYIIVDEKGQLKYKTSNPEKLKTACFDYLLN